jgi:3-hydroxyacyl-[acyl-carrier-protein] dehydratase
MTDVTELIPHRPPFLFVDRVVSHGEGELVAERTWRADEDFYRGHYPGAPITPGVLLCESVFQAGALLLANELSDGGTKPGVPLLARVSDVRFRSPVYPGDTITIHVKRTESIGGFVKMRGTMTCGERRILSVEFSVVWKEPAAGGPAA